MNIEQIDKKRVRIWLERFASLRLRWITENPDEPQTSLEKFDEDVDLIIQNIIRDILEADKSK